MEIKKDEWVRAPPPAILEQNAAILRQNEMLLRQLSAPMVVHSGPIDFDIDSIVPGKTVVWRADRQDVQRHHNPRTRQSHSSTTGHARAGLSRQPHRIVAEG